MPGLVGGMAGRNQYRGDGRFRVAVAVDGAVQELGCRDALGDKAHEAQFDVAGSQYGADFRVVKPGGRLVERILRWQRRTSAALKFRMRRSADPLGVDCPVRDCHVFLYFGIPEST